MWLRYRRNARESRPCGRYHRWTLMELVAEESTIRVHEFGSSELAGLLWAFAKLRHQSPASSRLCHHAGRLLVQRSDWKIKDLPVMIWSLSVLRQASLRHDALAPADEHVAWTLKGGAPQVRGANCGPGDAGGEA